MAGQKNNPTVIDLFSGVGGLSLGFEQEGFRLLFANDADYWIGETFKANHPDVPFFCGDIKFLLSNEIKKIIKNESVDIIVGGIPCQSFSMAGYRIRANVDILDDPRNFLFREFIRVVKDLRPKIFIIENVKGILSSQNGKIKEEIIKLLQDLGYKVDCKLLNSADYGVPQIRERVIFLGNRIEKENIFPKKTHDEKEYVPVKTVLNNVSGENHDIRLLEGKTLEKVEMIKPGQNWTSLPKDLQTKSRHSGAWGRIDPNKPSRTLTTRFDTPPVGYVTHPYENRTLTVREGARIQGFPDNFVFKGPKMSQFKQVGNAVPVGLSRALAKSVKKMLTN